METDETAAAQPVASGGVTQRPTWTGPYHAKPSKDKTMSLSQVDNFLDYLEQKQPHLFSDCVARIWEFQKTVLRFKCPHCEFCSDDNADRSSHIAESHPERVKLFRGSLEVSTPLYCLSVWVDVLCAPLCSQVRCLQSNTLTLQALISDSAPLYTKANQFESCLREMEGRVIKEPPFGDIDDAQAFLHLSRKALEKVAIALLKFYGANDQQGLRLDDMLALLKAYISPPSRLNCFFDAKHLIQDGGGLHEEMQIPTDLHIERMRKVIAELQKVVETSIQFLTAEASTEVSAPHASEREMPSHLVLGEDSTPQQPRSPVGRMDRINTPGDLFKTKLCKNFSQVRPAHSDTIFFFFSPSPSTNRADARWGRGTFSRFTFFFFLFFLCLSSLYSSSFLLFSLSFLFFPCPLIFFPCLLTPLWPLGPHSLLKMPLCPR